MTTLLLSLLLAASAAAAPAPSFKLADVQNAPITKLSGLAQLKGKVVYLEFWATWCEPCVAEIPRLNRLADALKGQPVVFLSVTDEDREKIREFRKTHEMKGWVGIDAAGEAFKGYRVDSRPDGFLIGKDGSLLAEVPPEELAEKDLRDALAGTFAPRVARARPGADAMPGKTFFSLTISSASGEPGMEWGRDGITAHGIPFADALAWMWDVQPDQVLADDPPVEAFDFSLQTPPQSEGEGRELLKRAVQSVFGFRVAPERRETDVFVLKLSTAAGAPRPKPAPPGARLGVVSASSARLLGNVTMARTARGLWNALGKPVLDETGLAGDYALDLEWKRRDRADLERVLATQGLALAPARSPVDFLRATREPRRDR